MEDESEHFGYLNKHEKEIKLRPFNRAYFDKKHASTFKMRRLPYWIETYGFWLNKENFHKMPEYHRTFTRGSVVMVDFGVQLANEFSGPHFAVVLSKNDDKYSPVLTVVPLSSKEKDWYAPLGYELRDEIIDSVNSLMEFINGKLAAVNKQLNEFQEKYVDSSQSYKFSLEESATLREFGIGIDSNTVKFTVNAGGKNKGFRKYIEKLKSIPDDRRTSKIQNVLRESTDILQKSDQLHRDLTLAKKLVPAFQSLAKKPVKYNKQTFANMRNITTISKLKIVKFSRGNVSENIMISDAAMKKIENKIQELI